MIKNKNRGGFIDRQRKWVVVGEKENILPSRALADGFEKNKKKNKTTSVYSLVWKRTELFLFW